MNPGGEVMELQMGPSHPAAHGTIKFNLTLDGETITGCDTEIGYLHRGFEKMCEQGTWTQCIPYCDRLNYASPLINDFIFTEAVERMLGVEVPERCSHIRVMLSEVSRITDHLTCLGMAATELGAATAGFYMVEARETLFNLINRLTGARVTVSYSRIGGLAADLPEDFGEMVTDALAKVRPRVGDSERLLDRNRIFLDRMAGVGVISAADAVSYGLTGPLLRATGIRRDLRKDEPYMGYDRFDFKVPVGSKGDNFDRFSVRMEEIGESLAIIEQCVAGMPPGTVSISDPKVMLPDKDEVHGSIEGLMSHFKLVIEGTRVPAGEIYFAGEAANGELGFYLVSDGSGRPYRVRVRPPCFYGMAALAEMIKGHMVSDLVAVFGMINMIGGECDR